ncbi:hypothetical protein DMH04_18415 [Kibdelosporangium aridum]|uniref:Uncharacterized protein n=1 Tax=Kibdelosporangium aridum TaxID=2030 RepID=A0A428ZB02_KIBAR|nr:hypothetical protein [Kibdelosporangium aridum]RSM85263.1 hypothetical protein DMH04_18415 [Kibdelosporangium aridum]
MGSKSKTHRAGVFDIRVVIALLIGAYGVVITVLGIGFTTDEQIQKSAGVNVNLWAGIGMLLFAAGFIAWAWLRPVKVPDESD